MIYNTQVKILDEEVALPSITAETDYEQVLVQVHDTNLEENQTKKQADERQGNTYRVKKIFISS